MKYDPLEHRYPSARSLVYGKRGMVCTSQPLAAQAGLDVLKKGGNAVDAAIAAAAVLTVVEPVSNSLGGDCFALVWEEGRLYGLNGSGRSPRRLNLNVIREAGLERIPEKGWLAVMVPGVPGAWAALQERFGNLSLSKDLESAVYYAREGFPVSPTVSWLWEDALKPMLPYKGKEEFEDWFRVFTRNGRTPRAGELWKLPDHGDTLENIGKNRARDFYRGALADRIDAFSKKTGGLLRKEDLEAYRPEWTEPIFTDYKGYRVWEMPPNGNGIVALMTLNMAKHLEFGGHDDADTVHQQVEAMKLAFADGLHYLADPERMDMSVEALLSEAYAAKRAQKIGARARLPEHGDPYCGGTVYLCTADESGRMVSFIQSAFDDFGSGIVVPGTGINLQDRGCGFSLNPDSPNCVRPGKRTLHTIIPGFLSKGNEAVGPFGVMGSLMQPQGHVQVLMNMIDFGMNPQDALNAPRWQWRGNNRIELEAGFGEELIRELQRRGHEVSVPPHSYFMGRGQMILRGNDGIYVGATEPRADGCVAAW